MDLADTIADLIKRKYAAKTVAERRLMERALFALWWHEGAQGLMYDLDPLEEGVPAGLLKERLYPPPRACSEAEVVPLHPRGGPRI